MTQALLIVNEASSIKWDIKAESKGHTKRCHNHEVNHVSYIETRIRLA